MGNLVPRNVKKSITTGSKLFVVVIGGPCSGKSTVTKFLSGSFQLFPIAVDQIIRECVDRESLRKPETRLERLHRKRLRTYNALLIHNKMTKDEKNETMGITMSSNHFSLHRQSDSEEDDNRGCPDIIREIKASLKHGEAVDSGILATLIHDTMWYTLRNSNGFVLDGYPRDVDQYNALVDMVGCPHVVVFLDCPDKVMIERAVERSLESQRFDDNAPFLRMKINAFHKRLGALTDKWMANENCQILNVNTEEPIECMKHEASDQLENAIQGKFRIKVIRNFGEVKVKKSKSKQH